MSHTSSNRVYECEVCGSTDRVSYHGMDSSLLCWKHMLEANRREDAAANAIPNSEADEQCPLCGRREPEPFEVLAADATPNRAADVLAQLRANVEALPFDGRQLGSTPISKQAVLDLIDGTAT